MQAAITSCNPTAGLGVLVHEGLGDRYTRRTAAVLGRAAAARGPLNLSDLIGLGIGLTPSGDDFLTGVALAEAVTILDKGNHRMLDRTALRCRIHTTSPAGRTLLIGALANQFPSYLVDVARAMCAPHPQRRSMIHHGVRVASEHGATSGIDSCVGIWWYLNWVIEGRSGVHHRR